MKDQVDRGRNCQFRQRLNRVYTLDRCGLSTLENRKAIQAR
jgi:hypothetical protein